MATREGTRSSEEFICICLAPDFCKSPAVVVPYKIVSFFDCAVNFSGNVRFRNQWAFRHDSRLSTVLCNEEGVGGGVLSGVNRGFCRPIDGTASTTVRVNGAFVDYHEGTYMFMNCAGPEGPFNTIGRVAFLGNMTPGPVSPSGKIPAECVVGISNLLSQLKASVGDVDDLVEKAKMLYGLTQTDWSDPSAVLGAIGGVAGVAGLQNVADLANKGKQYYDAGKKAIDADWSDPLQALSAVAGVAGVAEMQKVAQVAGLAHTIGATIRTDWSDPKAALASATNLMKATGLNQMAAQMLSNAILSYNVPVSTSGNLPPMFPPPGAGKTAAAGSPGSNGAACNEPIPAASDGASRSRLTPDVLQHFEQANPVAYARYMAMSDAERCSAFVELPASASGDAPANYDLAAIYIPGDGCSTTGEELDALPNVSDWIPPKVREVFVASKDDAANGNFFGIKEKEGNVYLFGGLIDLGSPGMPGAGTAWSWWVPDRILNADMSPYFDYHDKHYYGDNVKLQDLGKILSHEIEAFKAGATLSPLQLPLQAIYSAATTAVGVGTATKNSLCELGSGTFDSLGDFFSTMFGSAPTGGEVAPATSSSPAQSVGSTATLAGQSAPGAAGAPGAGVSPAAPPPPLVAAPAGAASGAGTDGMLVTIAPGNPTAAGAAKVAQFRADNQAALEKARVNERSREEQAANENSPDDGVSGEKRSPQDLKSSANVIENKIKDRYGQYLAKDKVGDKPASESMRIHNDHKGVKRNCGAKAAACYDSESDTIHAENSATDHVLAHEIIHKNASAEFKQNFGKGRDLEFERKFGANLNEGVTEYFASQVSQRELPQRHEYTNAKAEAARLAGELGEDTLRSAYFKGDSNAIGSIKRELHPERNPELDDYRF